MASVDTYEVDEIVGRRTRKDGKEDYLVRWQDYSPLLPTWEPIENFANCQEAIQEYFAKHWPIPGIQATSVVHLSEKAIPSQGKKELLTLQALPAKKRRKLLRGVRKDLKEEILRNQVEEEPLANSACDNLQLQFDLFDPEAMVKCNGTVPLNYSRSLRNRTIENQNHIEETQKSPHKNRGRPGRKSVEKSLEPTIPNANEQLANSVKQQYDQSKKLFLKSKSKLKGRRIRQRVNGIYSPRKKRVVIDSPSLALPSRLTRQTLPSCSSQCVLEEELVVTNRDGCLFIKICNEAKKNVINRKFCEDIITALHDAGKDDVSVVVISGSGSTFSYGWDLDQFEGISHSDRRELLQKYRLLTRMLLTCPKPLIAAVNGPAAGFGVSLAALCDFVFATEQATFQTKFTEWGHPPIGCCSFTLPHLMGSSQSMSMILFNTKISASTAKQCGLVTELLDAETFEKDLRSNIQRLLSVPLQCLRDTKTLLHGGKVQELENANHEESDFFLKYITNDTTLRGILAKWRKSIEE